MLSQEEAKRSNADQLLPEHVLLAMIHSSDGTGFPCCKNANKSAFSSVAT